MLPDQKNSGITHTRYMQASIGAALCILAGFLFAYIIGSLDHQDYLFEQMTIIVIELPVVMLYAVLARKNILTVSVLFALAGTVCTWALTYGGISVTPVIFLKAACMGILIGNLNRFSGSYFRKFSAVCTPGVLLALIFGLPIVFNGVSPEFLDVLKQDTIEVYKSVMTEDSALNSAENAMFFYGIIIQIGLAVYFIFAVTQSWLSLLASGWVMKRFKEEPEYIPPFYSYKLPFNAIWLFLAGGVFWIINFEPAAQVSLNVLAIMAGLYCIQGLAVIMYQANRISIGRLPKVLFWIIFFLMIGFSAILLLIIGIVDNWFNLRPVPILAGIEEERTNDESNS